MTAASGSLPSLNRPRSHAQVLRREGDPTKLKSIRQEPIARVSPDGRVVTTSDEWGTFLVPSATQPRQQWRVGDTVHLQFETGFTSFILELWQQQTDNLGARGGAYITSRLAGRTDVEGLRRTTTVNWIVQMYHFKFEYPYWGRNFYLVLRNGTGPHDNTFLSVTFNIFEQAAIISSTTSTTSSSSSITTSSATQTSTSSTGAPTSPAAAAASKDGGNTNVTTIALGAVLGLIGLVALVGLLFWLWKRRRQRQQPQPQEMTATTAAAPTLATELYGDASLFPGELESRPGELESFGSGSGGSGRGDQSCSLDPLTSRPTWGAGGERL